MALLAAPSAAPLCFNSFKLSVKRDLMWVLPGFVAACHMASTPRHQLGKLQKLCLPSWVFLVFLGLATCVTQSRNLPLCYNFPPLCFPLCYRIAPYFFLVLHFVPSVFSLVVENFSIVLQCVTNCLSCVLPCVVEVLHCTLVFSLVLHILQS